MARAKRRPSLRKTSVMIQGENARRGEKMQTGPYRLIHVSKRRVFVGSLIDTINKGKMRLAIFSVPKR